MLLEINITITVHEIHLMVTMCFLSFSLWKKPSIFYNPEITLGNNTPTVWVWSWSRMLVSETFVKIVVHSREIVWQQFCAVTVHLKDAISVLYDHDNNWMKLDFDQGEK